MEITLISFTGLMMYLEGRVSPLTLTYGYRDGTASEEHWQFSLLSRCAFEHDQKRGGVSPVWIQA